MAQANDQYAVSVARLEELVRALEPVQVEALLAATGSTETSGAWQASDLPFWFKGTAGVDLSTDQERGLESLWTRLMAAVAFAATGEDVDAWVSRSGVRAGLNRLVQRRASARIEGRATALLEGRFGGSVWRSYTGIWNAACAAVLEDSLEPLLFADLQATWRAVFHRPLQLTSVVAVDPFEAWR